MGINRTIMKEQKIKEIFAENDRLRKIKKDADMDKYEGWFYITFFVVWLAFVIYALKS